jgi:glutamate racemase
MDNRPIGVFDSGLGGLTAIKELEKLLPGEEVIYFGDTGRVPYGTKGRDTIIKYAAQIMRFLHGFDVKAVIIACNTVSSVAFEETASMSSVPVIGVVSPAAEAAVRATKNGRIGIIGTNATIRSGSYEKAILSASPDMQIRSRACPLFVPLVESGHFERGDRLAELAAHEYLDDFVGSGVDTVILGCTHYPILSGVIGDILGGGITLIDSGREAAMSAAKAFDKSDILSENKEGGRCSFYVSDYTEDFTTLAGILLEHSLTGYVEKTDIEKY